MVTDTCIIPVTVGLARWGDFITGWHFPTRKICFWWDIFLAARGIGSQQILGRNCCSRSLWASHICMCGGGLCPPFFSALELCRSFLVSPQSCDLPIKVQVCGDHGWISAPAAQADLCLYLIPRGHWEDHTMAFLLQSTPTPRPHRDFFLFP